MQARLVEREICTTDQNETYNRPYQTFDSYWSRGIYDPPTLSGISDHSSNARSDHRRNVTCDDHRLNNNCISNDYSPSALPTYG